MQIHTITIDDRDTWNSTLALMPYAHVLQTWEWGEFKTTTTGWRPHRIAFMHKAQAVGMAQILTRQKGPLRIMYVPKGPALDYTDTSLRQTIIEELKRYARERGAIFIKIDPDVVIGVGVPGAPNGPVELGEPAETAAFDDPLGQQIAREWSEAGLVCSREQVQFRNSIVVDLRRSEDDLLAAMKQKTRYNVRLGPRRDLTVRFGTVDDLEVLYRLYAETARRDGFVIRPFSYYRQAWGDFMRAGLAQPILAEYRGRPVAHVIIFGFARRAWYFYGASSDEERHRMPAYLLQWEAMRWAKSQGMAVYDFWGAPDNFEDQTDPLAGVFHFKQGFGGTVVRRIGAWDYPANPQLYGLYTRTMPAVLAIMRGLGRRRMQREEQSGA